MERARQPVGIARNPKLSKEEILIRCIQNIQHFPNVAFLDLGKVIAI